MGRGETSKTLFKFEKILSLIKIKKPSYEEI